MTGLAGQKCGRRLSVASFNQPNPRPLFLHYRSAHEADEEACEDDVLRALAGDELEIGIGAAVEGALELFE